MMDYSLLVGVHKRAPSDARHALLHVAPELTSGRHPTGKKGGHVVLDSPLCRNVWQVESVDGSEVYFIALIDMLTVYDLVKVVAHRYKRLTYTSVRSRRFIYLADRRRRSSLQFTRSATASVSSDLQMRKSSADYSSVMYL